MQKLKSIWSAAWLPVLSILLTCLYPCFFLFAYNLQEAPFTSMFPFFGVFLLNAAIFFGVFLLCIRKVAAAAFAADLGMLAVINFSVVLESLQKHWENFPVWGLMAVFGVVLLGIVMLLAVKRPNMRIPCGLIALTFGVLMVVNLAMGGITLLNQSDEGVDPETQAKYEPMTFTSEERPNVYFFLYDGYGGKENLLHYYNYDNEPFLTALEDRGFTVSRTSHNTESLLTVTLIPNLMNMNYVIRHDMTTAERNEHLVKPNFFRTFLDNGYTINLINHLDYFGSEGTTVLTHKQSRRTIGDFLLKNSLYAKVPAIKKEINSVIRADYVATYTGPLFDVLDCEKNAASYVGDGPTLTMGYVQCPHAPTILDKDGKLVENYENVGWAWDHPEYYLGQLEYVSSVILETVDNIQRQDPNALIILMSDHGCRQANHFYDMGILDSFDAPVENLYMQNTLNCVYYQGQSFPIEGETGINSLRLILNQIFGTDYERIEPNVYTEGRFEHYSR